MIVAQQGKQVVFHGSSLHDVAQWLSSTPRVWHGRYSETNAPREGWDLSAGMGGALRLARDGWSAGARDIETGEVDSSLTELLKVKIMDVAGYVPDVARYCAGEPRHMMSHKRNQAPIVHICISLWTSGGTTAETFIKYGQAMLTLIDQLENSGRRVELDVVFPTKPNGGYTVCAGWKVKRAGDTLDQAAIAFSLAHPAALRRIGFAMLERAPLAADDSGGYGHQCEFTEFMKNATDLEQAIFLPGVGIAHGYNEQQTNQALHASLGKAGIELRLEGEV